MATPTIGPGYSDSIGIRTNAQGAPEAYNKTNNQGFATPQELFGYASTLSGQSVGSWDQIAQGFTPKAQALGQVKNDLNSYQDSLFNTPDPTTQRQSSSITDSLSSAKSDYDNALQEYNDLKTKLENLQAPNYQQTYNDLTNEQGIPKLNTDIANTDAQRNDLPYVNRAASGNAGVETEGQLSADTAQKDIPLAIQQKNLIDRLQLAQNFVDNAMKFKEMDVTQARQSLTDAINTVAQSISISKDHLDTLNTLDQQNKQQQKAAQQFAYDNRISKPFYEIGGTIYRTSDQKAYSTPDQFFADGGAQDFSNVQTVSAPVKTVEVNPGNTLVDENGKVLYQAPYTPSKYTTSDNGFPAGAQTPGSAAAVNDPLGIKPNGKFAQFSSPEEGFQAGVQLIQSYQNGTGPKGINGNSTLNQMVNTWITGNPNNTQKTGYDANNVAQYLQQLGLQGVTPNTPIGQIDPTALAAGIAHFETGYTLGSGQGANNASSLSTSSSKVQDIVKNIIGSSNSWGAAAAALDRQLGEGAATQFDTQLKSKFQIPSDLVNISKDASAHGQDPHTWSLDQWQQNENQFVQDHSYNADEAKKQFENFFPKPGANENKPKSGFWSGVGNFFKNL